MTTPIEIGDMVIIIKSPYFSVKNGTIAMVENIKINHFGNNKHLYTLKNLSHRLFRYHEIKKIE